MVNNSIKSDILKCWGRIVESPTERNVEEAFRGSFNNGYFMYIYLHGIHRKTDNHTYMSSHSEFDLSSFLEKYKREFFDIYRNQSEDEAKNWFYKNMLDLFVEGTNCASKINIEV